MKSLVCENCGSTDLTIKENIAICNACNSKMVIGDDDYNLKSDEFVYEFLVDDSKFNDYFKKWLVSDAYAPNDILIKSEMGSLEKCLIPIYHFTGEYSTNYTVTIGYNRTEKYQEYDNISHKYVDKERKVTDWSPFSGRSDGTFNEVIVASSKIDEKFAMHINQSIVFKGSDAIPINEYSENEKMLPYDIDKNTTLKKAESIFVDEAVSKITGSLPGDTFKDFSEDTRYSYNTGKLYYPIYYGQYTYDGNSYTFIADGRNEQNIYGDRPIENGIVDNISAKYKSVTFWNWMLPIAGGILPFVFPDDSYWFLWAFGLLLVGCVFNRLELSSAKRTVEEKKNLAIYQKYSIIYILNSDMDLESKISTIEQISKGTLRIDLSQDEINKIGEDLNFRKSDNNSDAINNSVYNDKELGLYISVFISFLLLFILSFVRFIQVC